MRDMYGTEWLSLKASEIGLGSPIWMCHDRMQVHKADWDQRDWIVFGILIAGSTSSEYIFVGFRVGRLEVSSA